MRIVSQKKRDSVDFERILLWVQEAMIYAKLPNGDSIRLGVYKSAERALQVFMEIHEVYSSKDNVSGNKTYFMPEE